MTALTLLFVDDEEETRRFMMAGLNRRGIEAVAAANGAIALEHVRRMSFDVVVTDIVMPEMGGIALMKALNDLPLAKLPIRIVITSFADKENVKASLNAGVDHLLEKPFTADQLVHVVTDLKQARDIHLGSEEYANNLISQVFEQRLASLDLTEKERACVVFVLKGVANSDIATYCGVTEQTIKNRITKIYRKLGIGSRSQLFNLVFPI